MATNKSLADQPPLSKKAKTNDETLKDSSVAASFKEYTFVRVLKEMPDSKSIFLEAKCQDDSAVVILEKEAFGEENAKLILSDKTTLKNIMINDIYGTYAGYPQPEVNGIKVTVIHPATEKHIEKYSRKNSFFVVETPEMYISVVLPFLKENSFSHKWVYNILEHNAETERVIYEDSSPDVGFMLLPDIKWFGTDNNALYIIALPFRRDIRSLRDLSGQHLPLLKNIQEKTLKTIEEKYGMRRDLIRAYIHYQPSYYHFHIHFNFIGNNLPGTGAEKAHLLDTVISNLQNFPDYYQKVTLTYALSEDSPLYKQIKLL